MCRPYCVKDCQVVLWYRIRVKSSNGITHCHFFPSELSEAYRESIINWLVGVLKSVSHFPFLPSLLVPERTDSPDGGGRAGQSGNSTRAH